jgi:hypothetical protein
MASDDPKIRKQGTAGKIKHATSIVLQKLEILMRLESGKS